MGEITRRKALEGLGIAIGAVATGCGGSSDEGTSGSPTDPTNGPPTTNGTPAPSSTASANDDPPPSTDPVLTPKDALAAVEHIVVLVMENRSFDHFLGALKQDKGYAAAANIEGLTLSETNPAPDGTPVTVFKMSNFTPSDPPHGWDACHTQFNAGKNDGFVKTHAGDSQNEAMGYHDRSQIPLYYWFADNFAVCDHWHASVLGPTWPNRFYLHATTSNGKKDNTPFYTGAPPTIWEALDAKGVSAKNYGAGSVTWYTGGFAGKLIGGKNPSAKIDDFFADAKNGKLPAFCIIDPDFQASDDHPDHNIQRGQAFVASIYKALAESPLWPKTLFILTYDEHGGFFDHVAPPATTDNTKDFDQLGFRVPAFVIGGMVKKGYVCKTTLEHSSVAATLRTRFDIKDLSTRMAATADITDCLDVKKVKTPDAPPAGMPVVAMSMETALYDGVGSWSQPKLASMLVEGVAEKHDDRDEQERIAAWLEHAVRLGAVRIVG